MRKHGTKAPQFAADKWRVEETAFDADSLAVAESLFALANGYVGTRGTFEEKLADGMRSVEGTYLNGVYVREEIHYDESAFGFATHNNKMILVPNGKQIDISAGGEAFVHGASQVENHSRAFDMQAGLLARAQRWRLASGKALDIRTRRIVCLKRQNLMAIDYAVSSVDYTGKVTLSAGLDAGYGGTARGGDPRAGEMSIRHCLIRENAAADAGGSLFRHMVRDSDTRIVTACRHTLSGAVADSQPVIDSHYGGARISFDIEPGQTVTYTKYVWYGHGGAAEGADLEARAVADLAVAEADGFDTLIAEQAEAVAHFWRSADVAISGAPGVEQGMRFNMFHLYQSAGRNGQCSIAAKGLTGPGYDGHYFWDTEIYIVPFLSYTCPEVARSLLEYRAGKLDQARARARQMAHKKGALFPWRTIGGEECSSFFPAGTAQYHINAAIAYAALQYYAVSGDWDFIETSGAELLCETARVWLELGHFSERKGGKFCIHEVTGPDEYSAMADNNFYTNAMARHHLEGAARVAAEMQDRAPDAFGALADRLGLAADEVANWARAAELMHLPYDAALQVHAQDEMFLERPKWDFDGTPADKYPLLLNFHPLVIYRHQVLKQADVVLAMVLLADRFTEDEKRRNLAYYEPLTTHDSTLSACIYAVANAEVGSRERAFDFFEETYRMDLENRHGNTSYGVHTACMAGSWMGLVYGFAGMRLVGGQLSFRPYLPGGWDDFSFHLAFRGRRLKVTVGADTTRYEVVSGPALELMHKGQALSLTPGMASILPN
ncbi:MAG: glycoside hydrolase family 65 protein [Alphaproteobacteria bacterium]|nr:MAG: glycoside hydrolase family 65 protein [Alphaproteobacteria bacterium]